MDVKRDISEKHYERFTPDFNFGLTSIQVESRLNDGLKNKSGKKYSKSYWEILYTNVFTFFNILLFVIAAALIATKNYSSCFFLVVLFANMGIGLFQDIRAKIMVEKLRLQTAPSAIVHRDGVESEIPATDLVLDDIVVLVNGKQIPSDSIIVDGTIEVNESLLTGESVAVKKGVGEQVYAGSYVVSGKATIRIDKVGKDNYIEQLQAKAKTFKRPKSELLTSLNRILRMISYIIIPLGVALFVVGWFKADESIKDLVASTSGALVGMIPSGMFLLTSMTLAVGVIRLAHKKALVQELYSIEMLARVNVICFDKTGTLTDGTMSVKDVTIFDDFEGIDLKEIMGSFLTATGDQNQTALALRDKFAVNDVYKPIVVMPFSSERKYSAVTFAEYGTFVLGAPEFIYRHDDAKVNELVENASKKGMRVLLLTYNKNKISNDKIPSNAEPVAIFVIQDHVRDEAYDTIKWFNDNDVQVRIISGDNPITVSEIARQCGVEDADNYINLEGMSLEEVAQISDKYTVFGRVNPDQKAVIVQSLQKQGKTVAMTGDGVNDILALKNADCSVAMASGSEATRNVSHLVLMDSNFASMPRVVEEGRRVINNLQNTCSLFLVKTIFSILMSIIYLFVGFIASENNTYPFSPNHLYIWETAAIGVAAFFLALQPNKNRIKGGFVENVLARALPGGLTVVAAVSVALLCINNPSVTGIISEDFQITVAVLVMSFIGFVVFFRVCLPFNLYRTILYNLILIVTCLVVYIVTKYGITIDPAQNNIFDICIELLNKKAIVTTILICLGAIPLYISLDALFSLYLKKHKVKEVR